MIEEKISLNNPQLISVINNAPNQVDIHGRGTGKSFIIGWEVDKIVRTMPRSVTSITGSTYGQILTRTLPSTLKFLNQLNYVRDEDYVINKKPPRGWKTPYEEITKFDNFISFSNGTGFLMLSQERQGSSRGPNLDREIVDEALTIRKDQYDEEVSPANRGNEEHFGRLSRNPVTQHHGFRYVSSMPYSQEQRWLLEYGEYYSEEAGIQLFDVWNRIVKYQLQLINAAIDKDYTLFKNIWNEIIRLKRKIIPFVSKKSGVLFTLANAFDNLQNLGLNYILREFGKQSLLTFMVEILNWIIDKVEDCYYHIDNERHVYNDAINNDLLQQFAIDNNYDPDKLESLDSRFDLDCDPNRALEITPDWGSTINLFSIAQSRNYNFATGIVEETDCTINEFFNKPADTNKVMITDLVEQFSNYYRNHPTRTIHYYRDRYGDFRNPNVSNSQSYNQQAIAELEKYRWQVIEYSHKGQEPPQHDKYLLWINILKEADKRFPKAAFNGRKCKYTLISMNNTKVVELNGKFKKDKSSERSKKILPEEATHFSDAVDKRIWTKYNHLLLDRSSSFVSPRL